MELKKGIVVKAKAGRDKDQYFVVLDILKDGFVSIVNGKRRTLLNPKKKSLKHLQLTHIFLPDEDLTSNKKIKKLISDYFDKK